MTMEEMSIASGINSEFDSGSEDSQDKAGEDPRDLQITKLLNEVDFLKAKLSNAKVDIRKSAMASAIELPALKIQVETLEDELMEVEEIKKENETLLKELEEAKADALSAKQAALQMS
eukprot:CAMPEP_0194289568 /NCGR_PEP_ID=MMETSP0169-20130528/39310_1 /TAXON_ID=218684 /ORGANISM="Corethron pennatum, Strain L29A3" /LENGTH=117 /DNA_ID=CAMNT_0039036879 /DNA_START=236 /DNA_END=585 /DNA_ORIENTATION=-